MFLLDTNVVSEARKSGAGKADRNVIDWLSTAVEEALFLSSITMFEIELGILQISRRDRIQGDALRRWMEESVKPTFRDRIMVVDDRVALAAAALNVPDPRPLRDAFIGATAHVHGFTLVTRNVRDFQGLDIAIVNPWAPAG